VGEARLDEVNRKIAELEARRAELLDPKRQEIREAYGELERVLNRLDELGENVSNGDGYAVHVVGSRFRYTHGDDLQER
jgi:tetrahydromethanopterin S-methyltransferase subunit G